MNNTSTFTILITLKLIDQLVYLKKLLLLELCSTSLLTLLNDFHIILKTFLQEQSFYNFLQLLYLKKSDRSEKMDDFSSLFLSSEEPIFILEISILSKLCILLSPSTTLFLMPKYPEDNLYQILKMGLKAWIFIVAAWLAKKL